jgi:hypothetical protein
MFETDSGHRAACWLYDEARTEERVAAFGEAAR